MSAGETLTRTSSNVVVGTPRQGLLVQSYYSGRKAPNEMMKQHGWPIRLKKQSKKNKKSAKAWCLAGLPSKVVQTHSSVAITLSDENGYRQLVDQVKVSESEQQYESAGIEYIDGLIRSWRPQPSVDSKPEIDFFRPLFKRRAVEQREVAISVTGCVTEINNKVITVDWYGGGRLEIPRTCARGDWRSLVAGQWIKATLLRSMSGEVRMGILVKTIEEPKAYSPAELKAAYSSIPAAQLEAVE